MESSPEDRTISLGPILVDDAFLNIEQIQESEILAQNPKFQGKGKHIRGVILDDGTIHVPRKFAHALQTNLKFRF